jgi:alpha-tubulin suppressor-like RCC1 family protein
MSVHPSRRFGICVLTGAVVVALAAAGTSGAATTTTIVKSWGDNCCGQLGNGQGGGEFVFSTTPVNVKNLSGVKQVVGGGVYSLALMGNGTVKAWGYNDFGQLGDGTTVIERRLPVDVKGITNAVAVSAYAWTSLALLSNGTVMAWGDGESGELGDGTFNDSNVPVHVHGLSHVRAIFAGQNYCFALLDDGTVMGWGDNSAGELGTGSTGQQFDVPIKITRLSGIGVTQIAPGTLHAFALLKSGAILAWGANGYGELGLGEHGPDSTDVPLRVQAISTAVSVAAGYDDGAAVLANGTVMTWGSNDYGQLGIADRNVLASDDPIQVFGIHNAKSISLGATTDLALLSTGRMACWGEDDFGECGNGDNGGDPEAPAPVFVSQLTGVLQMSAGGGFGQAIVP